MSTTYNSNTDLSLGSIPEVTDPVIYRALLDIHNALEISVGKITAVDISFIEFLTRLRSVTRVTSNYTVLATDNTVEVNATGGNITITLPPVASSLGYSYDIKRVDNAPANSVVLVGSGAELVDGHSAGIKVSTLSSYTVKINQPADGWSII